MKNWMKIMLTAGGCMLAVGLVFAGIGVMIGGRPWVKFANNDFTQREWDNFWNKTNSSGDVILERGSGKENSKIYLIDSIDAIKNLKNIELDINMSQIIVKSGNKLEVEVQNILENEFECDYKNNKETLYVKYKINHKKNLIGKKNIYSDEKIIITVPAGIKLEEFDLESDVSEVRISGISAHKMNLNQGVGEVLFEGLAADELTLEGGVGEITGKNLAIKNSLDVTSGVGAVNLAGDIKGEISIENGVGETTLNLQNCTPDDYSYSVEPGVGEIIIDGKASSMFSGVQNKNTSTAKNVINISGGMGDLVINFNK